MHHSKAQLRALAYSRELIRIRYRCPVEVKWEKLSGRASVKASIVEKKITSEAKWGTNFKFTLSILVHKCLNNSAPPYLVSKIRVLSDDCNRSRLRSSNSSDVFVPTIKTKMDDRTFEVAGPRTWDSLHATLRESKTLPALKNSWNCTRSEIPSIRYCADSEHSCEAS